MTSRYSLTSTPGRFSHHVAREFLPPSFHPAGRSLLLKQELLPTGFGADVDSFVVGTNYEEYAVTLQLSRDRRSGEKSTNMILYSESRITEHLQGFGVPSFVLEERFSCASDRPNDGRDLCPAGRL